MLPDIALADEEIGRCRFDGKNDNYETSEIKKVVEQWFANKIKPDAVVVYVG